MNALARRPQRPWLNYVLGLALVAAIVVAYTSVGQASPSTAQTRRTATVAEGVVQSTVSGSGTLAAGKQGRCQLRLQRDAHRGVS